VAALALIGSSLSPPRAHADTATHAFPIRGAHSYGGELSRYGYARGRLHRGQDMAAAAGTPLVAVTAGRVSYRQYQSGGAGYYVVIQGDDGRDSVYMHMQSAAFVAPGQRVQKGQLIGRVGSTGSSTGPHLHFELWTPHWFAGGSSFDPLPSLNKWDIPLNPSGLAARSSSDQVALDWADNPPEGDLAGYRVYRRTPETTYVRIASTSTSAFVDRAVSPGTTYYYRVKAVDRLSNVSGYSNYATGKPGVAAAAYEQEVDNSDAERFAASTNWSRGTVNSQRRGTDYRYARPEAVSDTARYRLRVPRTGSYEVYVWYPAGSAYSASAPIGVKTTEGMRWQRVDQRSGGGKWVSLGVHPLAAGDQESVLVSRWTSAAGYVIADAVRLVER
jgi:Peptidase family M23